MNARSALFDIYGDHLLARGGAAPVAALVNLMAPLEIAGPAVRTAVSRMVAQGWLEPVRLPSGPGYQLTRRAEQRLAEAAARIYRSSDQDWDGQWHLVALEHIVDRSRRDRVRNGLTYLGYTQLRGGTWVSPHRSPELEGLLGSEKTQAHQFHARYEGSDAALAATAWDLDQLAAAYANWLEEARAVIGRVPADPGDEHAYVARTMLVHEWRKFLFRDPGLPREVLPANWPGHDAARFFDAESTRLHAQASRYVEVCLRRA
jgi:phenylacetic acid degradation operon negative regulatory protein